MESQLRVLVVDDEEGMGRLLKSIITAGGLSVRSFTSPRKALQSLEKENYDLAFVDIRMPEMNGLEFLPEALRIRPDLTIIVVTAYGSIENAVAAMKAGAYDYISKPFQAEEITLALSRIIERRRLMDENIRLRAELSGIGAEGFFTRSPRMREIIRFTRKIAPTRYSVLLTGESGTGKEVLARMIHAGGDRSKEPFVPVQCGLIPESLLESELFGYRKGAFTGASSDRTGLFEEADRGTLFLDEIGDINQAVQSKLLRFLEDHEIRRVGENKSRTLDVRLLAATNKNLEALVTDGTFREDLYYRLKVVTLHLPPLRERSEDIPLLAEHFLSGASKETGTEITLSNGCLPVLLSHEWPGNVRELKHCIETASILCEGGVITPRDIRTILHTESTALIEDLPFRDAKDKVIAAFEKDYASRMLDKTGGNITKAAEVAGMDKKNFWEILRRHGIDRRDFKK